MPLKTQVIDLTDFNNLKTIRTIGHKQITKKKYTPGTKEKINQKIAFTDKLLYILDMYYQ